MCQGADLSAVWSPGATGRGTGRTRVSNDGDGIESVWRDFIMLKNSLRNNFGRFDVRIEKEVVGDGSLRTDMAIVHLLNNLIC